MSQSTSPEEPEAADLASQLDRVQAMAEAFKQRALNTKQKAEDAVERAESRNERIAELENRVERLETALDSNPEGKVYDEMDLEERVHVVQH